MIKKTLGILDDIKEQDFLLNKGLKKLLFTNFFSKEFVLNEENSEKVNNELNNISYFEPEPYYSEAHMSLMYCIQEDLQEQSLMLLKRMNKTYKELLKNKPDQKESIDLLHQSVINLIMHKGRACLLDYYLNNIENTGMYLSTVCNLLSDFYSKEFEDLKELRVNYRNLLETIKENYEFERLNRKEHKKRVNKLKKDLSELNKKYKLAINKLIHFKIDPDVNDE